MAGDGTIVYNFEDLDWCVEQMKRATREIQGETSEFAADVKKILQDWTGDTAQVGYQTEANELRRKLEECIANLDMMASNVKAGASNMMEADRNGAKRFL